jgi:hypothetical protein
LIAAAAVGWIVLAQLRQQQKVIEREPTSSAALEEARHRAQAEAVDLAWRTLNVRETFVQVVNYSRRPIRVALGSSRRAGGESARKL